jgi:aspartyl-tRNA(Asn)/glutamyl-tRNA(Gln) amidotransferase subunit B
MFCDCLNDPLEKHPNVNVCPICTGHPGTLPTINKRAVEAVLKVGLALGSRIPEVSKFDRKNYFYPDLPKGYQISQYDMPLALGGALKFDSFNKFRVVPSESRDEIRIRRIHLEEDTGKNIHPEGADYSLVDFNRAGVPLMELVTEPDLHSAEEAVAFTKELQLLLRYLDVSDADMEKGQLRLEANVSVVKSRTDSSGEPVLGTKVEVKNLNSFRALEEAIRYEIERQRHVLEEGGTVVQETRGWDDAKKRTYSQRGKEEAEDYRYFPEPDLPPLFLGVSQELQRRVPSPFAERDAVPPAFDLEKLKRSIPELPWEKRRRFGEEYGLSPVEAELFVADPKFAEFFERAVSEIEAFDREGMHGQDRRELIRLLSNYLLSDLRGMLAESAASISDIRITPEHFAHLVYFVHRGKISSRGAKDVLRRMFETGADPETVVRERGIWQVSDVDALEGLVREIIAANQKAVEDYRKGKTEALQFLVGQTMAKSKGSANPKVVEEILKRFLSG